MSKPEAHLTRKTRDCHIPWVKRSSHLQVALDMEYGEPRDEHHLQHALGGCLCSSTGKRSTSYITEERQAQASKHFWSLCSS